MAVEPLNVEKSKSGSNGFWLIPISSAPTIMALGLYALANPTSPRWLGYLIAWTAMFMLGLGMAAIFKKQIQLEKRLDELERLN